MRRAACSVRCRASGVRRRARGGLVDEPRSSGDAWTGPQNGGSSAKVETGSPASSSGPRPAAVSGVVGPASADVAVLIWRAAWSRYSRPVGAVQRTTSAVGAESLCCRSLCALSVSGEPLCGGSLFGRPPSGGAVAGLSGGSARTVQPVVCFNRWWCRQRWMRLWWSVVPPCAQSFTWSMSQRWARREHPGNRQVSSRRRSQVLRSAGTA